METIEGMIRNLIQEELAKATLSRVGTPWDAIEDRVLQEEFSTFCATLAGYHRRSPGAIKSRLFQRAKEGSL